MSGFNDAILEATITEDWPGSPNQPDTYLHPDLADVWRVEMGTPGLTGNPGRTPTKIQSQIPCYVTHTMAAGATLSFPDQTGELVEQTDSCVLDGLTLAQVLSVNPEAAPGDVIAYNGLNYVVSYNLRGAFLDIQPFDVFVKGADVYLILRVGLYTDLLPSQALSLAFGKAPNDIPPP